MSQNNYLNQSTLHSHYIEDVQYISDESEPFCLTSRCKSPQPDIRYVPFEDAANVRMALYPPQHRVNILNPKPKIRLIKPQASPIKPTAQVAKTPAAVQKPKFRLPARIDSESQFIQLTEPYEPLMPLTSRNSNNILNRPAQQQNSNNQSSSVSKSVKKTITALVARYNVTSREGVSQGEDLKIHTIASPRNSFNVGNSRNISNLFSKRTQVRPEIITERPNSSYIYPMRRL